MKLLQRFAITLVRAMRPEIERAVAEAVRRALVLAQARTWSAQFATEAEWRAWCAQDEQDELAEMLLAEREQEIAAIEFEARFNAELPERARLRRVA